MQAMSHNYIGLNGFSQISNKHYTISKVHKYIIMHGFYYSK